MESTTANRAAIIRRFLELVRSVGHDITDVPYPQLLVQYFITSEIGRRLSMQSYKAWEAVVSFFERELGSDSSTWRRDARYIRFKDGAKKRWLRPNDQADPVMLDMLLLYSRTKKYTQQAMRTSMKYNELVKWTAIIWMFMCIARPHEVIFKDHEGKESYQGLRLYDVETITLDNSTKADTLQITLNRFKNQRFKTETRTLFMHNAECHSLNCTRCETTNAFKLYELMMSRRKQYTKMVKRKNPRKVGLLDPKNTSNPLFVLSTGKALTNEIAGKFLKQIVQHCPLRGNVITLYSLRIGGNTSAHRAGVDHSKLAEYVGWRKRTNILPNMGWYYTKYSPQLLQWIMYDIIHGPRKQQDNNLYGQKR